MKVKLSYHRHLNLNKLIMGTYKIFPNSPLEQSLKLRLSLAAYQSLRSILTISDPSIHSLAERDEES